MLDFFRKRAQSLFIQAIVVVIALVFIFWGVGTNMMNKQEAAIIVNGEEISFQDYQQTYDRAYARIAEQFGGTVPKALADNLDIRGQVISQLIQEALLRQGGHAMGLLVSGREVQEAIESMGQFQHDGAFDLQRYQSLLAANRLSPKKYEESLKHDLLDAKTVQALSSFVTSVSDAEIEDLYNLENETVTIAYTVVSPEHYLAEIDVAEEDLRQWYEAAGDRYKTEEAIKLTYLPFSFTETAAMIANDEEEMSNELRLEKARSLAFQEAGSVYEQIIGAGSLDAYLEDHPDTTAVTTDFFSRSTPPEGMTADPNFLDVAFSLREGELSSLIEVEDGYAIIAIDAIREPQVPELNQVRHQAEQGYRRKQAADKAHSLAQQLIDKLGAGASFAAVTDEHNLPLDHAGPMKKNEPAPSFPQQLVQEAFRLSRAEPVIPEPALVDDDYYVFQLEKRSTPEEPISDAERQRYRELLIEFKQQQLVEAWLKSRQNQAKISIHHSLQRS